MDLLEFLPCCCWSFGDDLTVLGDFLEKTKQVAPFPALKENRVCRKATGANLLVFDPAEISTVEITVGYLKFRTIAGLAVGGTRARDLFMSNHLSQEFPSTLQLRQDKLTRPVEAQRIGCDNH